MKKMRTAALLALPALVLALSACSFNVSTPTDTDPTVEAPLPTETETASAAETTTDGALMGDPVTIENATADQIEQQIGVRPYINCGAEPVKVVVGDSIICDLNAPGESGTYDLTVTFTSVSGEQFDFDFVVAGTPRP